MKNHSLFDYPKYLNKIFDKLNKNGIKSIIVGGYIRDFFLDSESKDIDVELYGVNSFTQLEKILQEFGSVNSVGKSFGVCKLSLETIEIDFTLPRRDNKTAPGHSGFLIETDKTLDFKTASSRRDFTINSIGFDIQKQTFIDPYNGINDIKNKNIKAVDLEKFAEDPLRVFRAISFSSRLNFSIEDKLFLLCRRMCEKNILLELPKERIYDEIKKILLKSQSPSIAFILLKNLNGLKYLHPLDTLNSNDFSSIMQVLDNIKKLLYYTNATKIYLLLCTLCYKFNKQQVESFISNITNKSKLANKIYSLVSTNFQKYYNDSELLLLATKVNIEHFLTFSQAIHPTIDKDIFTNIKERAIQLNILNTKQEELLKGRDLLALGVKPSKEYSKILSLAYKKQLNLEILSHQEAVIWLKKYLLS